MNSGARRAGLGETLLGVSLALAMVFLSGSLAEAQVKSGAAEIKSLTGKVEVLRRGQSTWVPADVGDKLVEGDDIRAYPASSAELELPDSSTLLLAENSRLVMTKLEFDRQNQARTALFHLAAGKVRAIVTRAALALVRARQSNFAITTPTAVAAARGTDFEVTYDPQSQTMRIAVLEEDGHGPKGAGAKRPASDPAKVGQTTEPGSK